jgi:hypothetical protein
MLLTILFLSLLCIGFAWQCWRDLAAIRRELERHQRGRAIRERVLAEAAKLRTEVQP